VKIVTLSTYTTKRETRAPCACRRIVHCESVTFLFSYFSTTNSVTRLSLELLPLASFDCRSVTIHAIQPQIGFLAAFHPFKLKPRESSNVNAHVCTSVALPSTACAVLQVR
jgi:hypothetical protein